MFRTILRGVAGVTLALALVACGQQSPNTNMAIATQTASSHPSDMDHGEMSETASAVPYDARFIDSMIEHHRGALAMAEQAQDESERPEIRQLAGNIISTQNEEIAKMTSWRTAWYPGLAATGGTGMSMGDMHVSDDASMSFDQRFIMGMISHHQGAIAMARDAQAKAEHPEIKDLANQIITAQESEIAQMEQWNRAWFAE